MRCFAALQDQTGHREDIASSQRTVSCSASQRERQVAGKAIRHLFSAKIASAEPAEMDGLTTTRHCRGEVAALQRPRVPVIGLTGDVYAGAREACLEAGMDDYLTKPASRADVGAVLARWAPEALQR